MIEIKKPIETIEEQETEYDIIIKKLPYTIQGKLRTYASQYTAIKEKKPTKHFSRKTITGMKKYIIGSYFAYLEALHDVQVIDDGQFGVLRLYIIEPEEYDSMREEE